MGRIRFVSGLVAAALMVAACGGTTGGPSSSCSKTFKVGQVTDIGKLSDKSFNFDANVGLKAAQSDPSLCVKGAVIESTSEDDYAKNIKTFLDQKYDMIVTVGFKLGDATLKAAQDNPGVKFAIVDYTYKTYPSNLAGLVFSEDQPGFLAGALAGLLTKTNVIGEVAGLESVPPVVHYVQGFENGAKFTNPKVHPLHIYQPESGAKDFNDPDWGKQQALTFIGQGADIIFGVGGNTGNGGLIGANEQGKMCVGVDVDQYLFFPELRRCFITSAEKLVHNGVKTAITNLVKGTWVSGTVSYNLKNNGVALGPYHDFDSKISASSKAKIKDIMTKLKDGSLSTGVTA